jgi:membrane-associated protease RseP (regulator of RpoE activity)
MEGGYAGLRPFFPLLAFLVTVFTVFQAGAGHVLPEGEEPSLHNLWRGWTFAVPLLTILVSHEFGHYIAARIHRVPASLPYFIPMPWSIFGTWGAVIGMSPKIPSRRALLDIGAAGPLAGMVFAIPILAYGLTLSHVQPIDPAGHSLIEGQSLLYMAMKRVLVGPIGEGYDVFLHPVAFAGWAGLFVTMINLLPFGQLDGGHIAYSLFGVRQDRYAGYFHKLLIPLFLLNVARNVVPVVRSGGSADAIQNAVSSSMFWLMWALLLGLMTRIAGKEHPPTPDVEPLTGVRAAVAIVCLVLFVLLFMPFPITIT